MRPLSRRLPAPSPDPRPLLDYSAGYVGLMSANADKLARNAKVHDLHREMKTSVSELVGVTNEIRRGIDPVTVGREMLAARERQARELGAGGAGGVADGAGEPDARAPGSVAATSRPRRRLAANGAATTTTRVVRPFASRTETKETDPGSDSRIENFMPFSAVSLGRLNPTDGDGGDGVFGARLLADALEERAVAADAISLARSGALDRSVAERKAAYRNRGVEVVRDR